MSPDWSDLLIRPLKLFISPLKAVHVCARFLHRVPTLVRITRKALRVGRSARVVSGKPEPAVQRVQEPWLAYTCLVHLHGINTLYHAVSAYTGSEFLSDTT